MLLFRRFITVLVLVFALLTSAYSAGGGQPQVYSNDLFNRKGTPSALRWSSMAPMSSPFMVTGVSSHGSSGWNLSPIPSGGGHFNASQLYDVGQQNLPVIATTTADATLASASGPMRVGRPDDGNGGHTDVNQPLGIPVWFLLLLAAGYCLVGTRRDESEHRRGEI